MPTAAGTSPGEAILREEIRSVHLRVDEARALAMGVLTRHGYDEEDAALITDVLVEAHLWGRPDSGLNHLSHMFGAGARRPISVVREDDVSVLLDGGNNPGFLVSSRAMLMAIEKAKSRGIAMAAARNAFLGGINGYYVSMAARADLIGLMATSSGRRVAPAGGIDPLFGTNPLAVAFPTNAEPIVLDLATASVNVGVLRRAARVGEEIAEGVAIDAEGSPTTDPALALQGAILPFGGHKGSALAMMVQCFGLLCGGPVIPEGLRDFGYFFLVIDPSRFIAIDEYKARASELVTGVHAVRPAEGVDTVRVPGERSFAARRHHLEQGIEIDDALYEELCRL